VGVLFNAIPLPPVLLSSSWSTSESTRAPLRLGQLSGWKTTLGKEASRCPRSYCTSHPRNGSPVSSAGSGHEARPSSSFLASEGGEEVELVQRPQEALRKSSCSSSTSSPRGTPAFLRPKREGREDGESLPLIDWARQTLPSTGIVTESNIYRNGCNPLVRQTQETRRVVGSASLWERCGPLLGKPQDEPKDSPTYRSIEGRAPPQRRSHEQDVPQENTDMDGVRSVSVLKAANRNLVRVP